MKTLVLACAALASAAFAQAPSPDLDAAQLEELAARIVASQDAHERVQLATFARRFDTAGSVWWYEVELEARRAANEPAAVLRVATEALRQPLTAADRARLLAARAQAYAELHDVERQLGDLGRAVALDPHLTAERTRLHTLLAERIETRRVRRDLRMAEALYDADPESLPANVEVARAARAVDDSFRANDHFRYVLGVEAQRGVAPEASALTVQDLFAASDAAESVRAYGDAIQFLEAAAARDASLAESAEFSARLEALRADRDALPSDPTGYGYGYGYGEMEGAPPVDAPGEWDTASLTRLANEAEAALGVVVATDTGALLDTMWALQELLDNAEAAFAADDLAALERAAEVNALQDAIREITPWQAQAETYRAADRTLAALGDWIPWAASQLDLEEPHTAACARVVTAYEAWLGLPSIEPDDLLGRAEGLLPGLIAARQRVLAWKAEALTLASERDSLPPAELRARANALLAAGGPEPVVLALAALGHVRAGSAQLGLGPLHLAHAGLTAPPAPMHAELAFGATLRANLLTDVEGALATLDAQATNLARAARLAIAEQRHAEASALAERAVDLAPLRADLHALEGEALAHARHTTDALRPLRIASGLAPDDLEIGALHFTQALEARTLGEAFEVAERLRIEHPREPAAILRYAFVRELLGDEEGALKERRFAHEMSGRQGYDFGSREWVRFAGTQSMFLQGNGTARFRDEHDFRMAMPWVPSGGRGGASAIAVAARVFPLFDAGGDLSGLDAPLEGMTDDDVKAWDGVADFYMGELVRAREGRDAAKPHYERCLRTHTTPALVAYLAGTRLRAPLRHNFFVRTSPIVVPYDIADVNEAVRRARPGQRILLAGGTHAALHQIDKSVELVGLGDRVTTLQLSVGYSTDNPARDFFVAPASNAGNRRPPAGLASVDHGWVELSDLALYGFYGRDEDLAKGELKRVDITAGTLALRRVRLQQGTALVTRPGSWLTALDADWAGAYRDPLEVAGGRALLDRVVLGRAVRIDGRSGAAQLLAGHLALVDAARLEVRGGEARLDVHDLSSTSRAETVITLQEGAAAELATAHWRAWPDQAFTNAGRAIADRMVALHSSALHAPLPARTVVADIAAPAPSSGAGEAAPHTAPLVVADGMALRGALASDAPWIQLQPGAYVVSKQTIDHDVLIEPVPDATGVVELYVREDWSRELFVVAEHARLVLRGVQLGTRNWVDPPAGSDLARLGAKLGVEPAFSDYALVKNAGLVWLDDVRQSGASTGDVVARVHTIENTGAGRAFVTGLAEADAERGGSGLLATGTSQTWCLDGGFENVTVRDAAEVVLLGRGCLDTLEVTGPKTQLVLGDQRPDRLTFSAFRQGAHDPRSAIAQRFDGGDPARLQVAALDAARAEHLDPLQAGPTQDERARHLAAYGQAHARALVHTVADRRVRFSRAAEQVIARVGSDRDLMRAVFEAHEALGLEWALAEAFYREMPRDLYIAVVGMNRAERELGEGASAEDLRVYSTWEEAVLAGTATAEDMAKGKALGMDPNDYALELARQAAERARLEEEATAALATGDRAKIKAALMRIDRERWLEYLANDDTATLDELEAGIEIAYNSAWYYHLTSRHWNLERELRRSQSHTGYSNPTWSPSSSYSAPDNSFNNWVKDMNTRNAAMTQTLNAISNSSYSSYRNTYNY